MSLLDSPNGSNLVHILVDRFAFGKDIAALTLNHGFLRKAFKHSVKFIPANGDNPKIDVTFKIGGVKIHYLSIRSSAPTQKQQ